MSDIPRCEDGPICDRGFAPTTHGNQCIRCGHIDECHVPPGLEADSPGGPFVRICFWKRDDKTVETGRKKFGNLGPHAFAGEPHVQSEDTDGEWPLVVPDVQKDKPSLWSIAQRALSEAIPKDAPAFTFENVLAAKREYDRLTSAVIPAHRRLEWHDLYDAIRRLPQDDDLKGFRLSRITLRTGEWARLMPTWARFRDENDQPHSVGTVGTLFVDAAATVIPVFEIPFFPDRLNGRRVIAILTYETAPVLMGTLPFHKAVFESGHPRIRILTD